MAGGAAGASWRATAGARRSRRPCLFRSVDRRVLALFPRRLHRYPLFLVKSAGATAVSIPVMRWRRNQPGGHATTPSRRDRPFRCVQTVSMRRAPQALGAICRVLRRRWPIVATQAHSNRRPSADAKLFPSQKGPTRSIHRFEPAADRAGDRLGREPCDRRRAERCVRPDLA
jgi:hypothetical protein